jgi:hypothetical protein
MHGIIKRLAAEIRLWKGLDHDNVLPLLGTVSDFGPQTSLVSPWLEEGRLTDYLERCERDLDLVRRLQLVSTVSSFQFLGTDLGLNESLAKLLPVYRTVSDGGFCDSDS